MNKLKRKVSHKTRQRAQGTTSGPAGATSALLLAAKLPLLAGARRAVVQRVDVARRLPARHNARTRKLVPLHPRAPPRRTVGRVVVPVARRRLPNLVAVERRPIKRAPTVLLARRLVIEPVACNLCPSLVAHKRRRVVCAPRHGKTLGAGEVVVARLVAAHLGCKVPGALCV